MKRLVLALSQGTAIQIWASLGLNETCGYLHSLRQSTGEKWDTGLNSPINEKWVYFLSCIVFLRITAMCAGELRVRCLRGRDKAGWESSLGKCSGWCWLALVTLLGGWRAPLNSCCVPVQPQDSTGLWHLLLCRRDFQEEIDWLHFARNWGVLF